MVTARLNLRHKRKKPSQKQQLRPRRQPRVRSHNKHELIAISNDRSKGLQQNDRTSTSDWPSRQMRKPVDRDRPTEKRTCHHCHRIGHLYRDCRFAKPQDVERIRQQYLNSNRTSSFRIQRVENAFVGDAFSTQQNHQNTPTPPEHTTTHDYYAVLRKKREAYQRQFLRPAPDSFCFHYVNGDLFQSKDSSLAHCVSSDLRMGAGIARSFRDFFGRVEELRSRKPKVGSCLFLQQNNRYIFYLVTKRFI